MVLKQKSEHSVHVRLDAPVDKRKAVLQTAIDAVELMKKYETIRKIKHEKALALAEFQKVVGHVHRLVKQIEISDLPMDLEDLKHVHTPTGKRALAPLVRRVKNNVVKSKKEEAPKNSLDAQLDALRRKLENL